MRDSTKQSTGLSSMMLTPTSKAEEQGPAIRRNATFNKTSALDQAYESKLHSLLEKMHPRSNLSVLLSVDDKRSGARRNIATSKSDINTVLSLKKGVELKSNG